MSIATAISRAPSCSKLAGDLLERAFDGSARGLLLHALEHKKASPEELDELRRLIDELERRSR